MTVNSLDDILIIVWRYTVFNVNIVVVAYMERETSMLFPIDDKFVISAEICLGSLRIIPPITMLASQ